MLHDSMCHNAMPVSHVRLIFLINFPFDKYQISLHVGIYLYGVDSTCYGNLLMSQILRIFIKVVGLAMLGTFSGAKITQSIGSLTQVPKYVPVTIGYRVVSQWKFKFFDFRTL